MKKEIIRKRIFGTVSFVLILLVVLLLLSYAFSPQKPENVTMQNVKPNALLAEPDNTIDVLFLGDSEAYASFSPIQLWNEKGFPSFVCATSSQYVSLTESFVHQAFEHQSPKLVVLEPYSFYREMHSDNALVTRIENMFSIIQYHNRWKTMLPHSSSISYTWRDDLKGFKYIKTTTKAKNKDYMKKCLEIESVPAENARYIQNIVNYCNKRGAKVLFVSVPSCKNWNYKRHNGVEALAKKLGVQYLDLNLEKQVDIDWRTDTADAGDHLNYRGVKKVNTFLSGYLAGHYDLQDKRSLSAYSSWNDCGKVYSDLFRENNEL